jgi:DNA-binding response OmpR family regulator
VPWRPKRTALVVEDDAQLRDLYRVALRQLGFVVAAASDGVEALRHLEATTPNLIILDLGLPRLSGRDVQREIAAHREIRDVPIIVVTGEDTLIPNPSDYACVLRKPIDLETLAAAIQKCLGHAV